MRTGRLLVIAWMLVPSGCGGAAATSGGLDGGSTQNAALGGSTTESFIDASCVNPSYESEYDAASNVGCRLWPEPSVPMPLSGLPGCGAAQYLVYCLGPDPLEILEGGSSAIPAPAASLNCSDAPANLIENQAFYCCPCSD